MSTSNAGDCVRDLRLSPRSGIALPRKKTETFGTQPGYARNLRLSPRLYFASQSKNFKRFLRGRGRVSKAPVFGYSFGALLRNPKNS